METRDIHTFLLVTTKMYGHPDTFRPSVPLDMYHHYLLSFYLQWYK